ncbi:MAG: hypothetical protein SGILL_008497 [Bacillariaceae sp.]
MKLQLIFALLALSESAFAFQEGEGDSNNRDATPHLRRNLQGWGGHGHRPIHGGMQGEGNDENQHMQGGGNDEQQQMQGGGNDEQQQMQGGGFANRRNMGVIRNLLEHRDEIERVLEYDSDEITVISANTTSKNPQVSKWIRNHVANMMALKENGGWIRAWDPLFEALFEHRDDMELKVDFALKNGEQNGVQAWLTGNTSCAEALAQAHYHAVSAFVDEGDGDDEVMHTEHDVPSGKCLED